MWKKEKMLLTSIFSFFHNVFKRLFLKTSNLSFVKKKILWKKEKMLVTSISSFSHNVFKSLFLKTSNMSFVKKKALWKKDKMLVTSIFSFSHDVFKRLFKTSNLFFTKEENIVEKGENVGYQHFLLFPHCFQKAFPQKIKFVFHKRGKHCGKGRKCLLPAFSPIPTMLSKCFSPWASKFVIVRKLVRKCF